MKLPGSGLHSSSSALTLAVRVEIQHAARPHHRLQGDDLIQRHSEELVLVEPPRRRVVRFMRTEVVVAEGKPLPPGHEQQIMMKISLENDHKEPRRGERRPDPVTNGSLTSRSSRASRS